MAPSTITALPALKRGAACPPSDPSNGNCAALDRIPRDPLARVMYLLQRASTAAVEPKRPAEAAAVKTQQATPVRPAGGRLPPVSAAQQRKTTQSTQPVRTRSVSCEPRRQPASTMKLMVQQVAAAIYESESKGRRSVADDESTARTEIVAQSKKVRVPKRLSGLQLRSLNARELNARLRIHDVEEYQRLGIMRMTTASLKTALANQKTAAQRIARQMTVQCNQEEIAHQRAAAQLVTSVMTSVAEGLESREALSRSVVHSCVANAIGRHIAAVVAVDPRHQLVKGVVHGACADALEQHNTIAHSLVSLCIHDAIAVRQA